MLRLLTVTVSLTFFSYLSPRLTFVYLCWLFSLYTVYCQEESTIIILFEKYCLVNQFTQQQARQLISMKRSMTSIRIDRWIQNQCTNVESLEAIKHRNHRQVPSTVINNLSKFDAQNLSSVPIISNRRSLFSSSAHQRLVSKHQIMRLFTMKSIAQLV